jgi:hypothetical protein
MLFWYALRSWVRGLGFRVQGLGFRVYLGGGWGLRVWNMGFRVYLGAPELLGGGEEVLLDGETEAEFVDIALEIDLREIRVQGVGLTWLSKSTCGSLGLRV